jgi:hypothetical protein
LHQGKEHSLLWEAGGVKVEQGPCCCDRVPSSSCIYPSLRLQASLMLLNSPVVLHQLQKRRRLQHRGQPQDPSPTSNKKNRDRTTPSVTLLLHRPSSRQHLSPSTSSNGESLSNRDQ